MFEWDDANIGHIAKHKISPEEAEQVIENNPLDLPYQFVNVKNAPSILARPKQVASCLSSLRRVMK